MHTEVFPRLTLWCQRELVLAFAQILLNQEVSADAVGSLLIELGDHAGANITLCFEQSGGFEFIQAGFFDDDIESRPLVFLQIQEMRLPGV